MMDMVVASIVMMVLQLYTYPQTHQVVYIKYDQLCDSHLSWHYRKNARRNE